MHIVARVRPRPQAEEAVQAPTQTPASPVELRLPTSGDRRGVGERPGGTRVRSPRQWTPLAHALAATGDQWTLLIVLQLAHGTSRLTRLQERLPGISTGVLDHHLHQMAALGLLSRQRFREAPPRVEVGLTETGRELLPIAEALARWGMLNMWSDPKQTESVDIQLLIGLLPALLATSPLPEAIVEVVFHSKCDGTRRLLSTGGGQVTILDHLDSAADARVEGDTDAWVAALGPAADYSSLALTGNTQLIHEILDALPRRGQVS
ncbi:MAG: winged helix-turn-helix transcriptional regulator [Solirubrobacteraceae bacterium]